MADIQPIHRKQHVYTFIYAAYIQGQELGQKPKSAEAQVLAQTDSNQTWAQNLFFFYLFVYLLFNYLL